MDNKRDKIKDLFSSKLLSFEPVLPVPVWGELDQILSKKNIFEKAKPEQSMLKAKLLKIASVAACLVAVTSAVAAIVSLPEHDDVLEVPKSLIHAIRVPEKKKTVESPELIVTQPHVRRKIKIVDVSVMQNFIVEEPTMIVVKKRTSLYTKPIIEQIYFVNKDGKMVRDTVSSQSESKGGLYTLSTEERIAKEMKRAAREKKKDEKRTAKEEDKH